MKNYVQPGEILTLIAPSGGVTAGVGVLIGAIFAVASVTAAEGEEFAGAVRGVFDLAAATHASTQAIAAGAPAYWDNTAKVVTATAAGNTVIGVVTEDKVSTVAVARVALVPRAIGAGATIADLSLAAVAGVDGTGSNAASKADTDARFASIVTKVNAILAAMETGNVVVS